MDHYNKYYFVLLGLFLSVNLPAFGIEESNFKLSSSINKNENIILKGNVKETGIGVIGLRLVHQKGYPLYVEEVYPDSPASRIGIRTKDLIFVIDGIRTDYLSSYYVHKLLTGEPGTKAQLFIARNQTILFNVELIREDLANFSPEIQNRYLSETILIPINITHFIP